jgi:hypothetical protein
MAEEKYIERKPEKGVEHDFYDFRRKGIEILQQLSGNNWTDFNLHDPGLTILEQCCYALTELVYKSKFPIRDYLTGNDGNIDYQKLALYMPWQIYPSSPVTSIDTRKVLLDEVADLTNVWLLKSDVSGLYNILIDIPDEYHSSPDKIKSISQKVKKAYCKNRRLCENINKITLLKSEIIDVVASVKIDEAFEAEIILAEVFLKINDYFSPGYRRISYDDKSSEIKDLDVLFDGPLLENGFIPDTSLQNIRYEFNTAELIGKILQIEGITNIVSLHFENKGSRVSDHLKYEKKDLNPGFVIPENKRDLKIKLIKSGRQITVNLNKAKGIYKKKLAFSNLKYYNVNDIENTLQVAPGIYRNFNEHYTIQNDFPDIYGIGEFGIPDSESNERKAQAKQLKAYLSVFDQTMFNYVNQLQNLKHLYSINNSESTYSFSTLYRDFPLSEIVLLNDKDIDKKFKKLQKLIDYNYLRKNELLDYIISLYGDELDLRALVDYNYYDDDYEKIIIQLKVLFLKNITSINQRKGIGINYLKSDNDTICNGMRNRSLLELGINNFSERMLSDEFIKYGLNLLNDEDFLTYKTGADSIAFTWTDEEITGFYDVLEQEVKDEIDFDYIKNLKDDFYLISKNIIYDSLLKFGVDLKFYKVGVLKGTEFYTVVFKSPNEENWQNMGMFKTNKAAILGINRLQKLLKTLNIKSEGVHLLEKILLKGSWSLTKYSVSIKLPDIDLTLRCLSIPDTWKMNELDENLYNHMQDISHFSIEEIENPESISIKLNFFGLEFLSTEIFNTSEQAEEQIEIFTNALSGLTIKKFRETGIDHKANKEVLFSQESLSNRICLILPSWTSRFSNSKFRMYVEGILHKNCPAHIYPEFYWMDFIHMEKFEKYYQNWLKSMSTEDEDQVENYSFKILSLLESHKNNS